MSVINRLEVSNCINLDNYKPKHKDWSPHYPYLELNFRGYSAAIKATNGTGKTTLNNGYYSLTTRDRTMNKKFKDRMAPKRKGVWSHFRLEMLYETPGDNIGPQLFGPAATGESWVFGMYGYCDDDVRFYCYRGHLEDCPLVTKKDGHKREVIHNDEFITTLKLLPDVNIALTVPDWKKAIGRHIDENLTQKMLAYHKAGGGDGTANFFKVNKRTGEDYDTAFFYSHIAPETLVDCMGQYGEEDEKGFEDTLLKSAKGVLDAKYSVEKHAKNIEKLSRTHTILAAAKEYADAHNNACKHLAKEAKEVLAEYHFLRGCLKEDALPLLPIISKHGSSQTQYIANGLVLQDGEWLLPDYVLSEVTGSESKVINQLATRKKQLGKALKRSQVIEIPCDLMIHRRKDKANPGRAYRHIEALAICRGSPRFAEGWSLDAALRAINHAWDWRNSDGEHNVFRKLRQKSEKKIDELGQDIGESERRLNEKTQLLQRVNGEIQAIDQAVAALSAMRQSGLFTEGELSNPAATEAGVCQSLKDAEQNLRDLQEKFIALEDGRRAHARITAEFSPQSANEAMQALIEDEANAEQLSEDAKRDQRNAKDNLRHTSQEQSNANDQLSSVRATQGDINLLVPHMKKYESLFVGEDPCVLAETVPDEREQAKIRKGELTTQIKSATALTNTFSDLASGVTKYREIFNNEPPHGLAEKVTRDLNDAEHTEKNLSDRINQLDKQLLSLSDGQANLGRVFERFGKDVNVSTLERELEDQEKQSTTLVTQLGEKINRLVPLVDSVANFKNHFPDVKPAEVTQRRETRRNAVAVDINRLVSEKKMADKQIADLESVGTAAGRIANEVLNCIGGSPLLVHQAIAGMRLSPDRKKAVMAHFSHVLHSPVFQDSNDAKSALERLVAGGIEAPVFDLKGLIAFCENGDLSWADAQATGLLIGLETLHVKAILDPSYIPALIEQLQQDVEGIQRKLTALKEERNELSPDSDLSKLIALARQATDEDAAVALDKAIAQREQTSTQLKEIQSNRSVEVIESIRLASHYIDIGGDETLHEQTILANRLQEEADSLKQMMPEIIQRASENSLGIIQSMLDYTKLGGMEEESRNAEKLQNSTDELSEIEQRLPTLESRYGHIAIILKAKEFIELGGWEKAKALESEMKEIAKRIDRLREQAAKANDRVRTADEAVNVTNARLRDASNLKSKWEDNLIRAIEFTDEGGTSFDASYQERHTTAQKTAELADKRSRFQFTQAQQAADAENDPLFSENKVRQRDELNIETNDLRIRISGCRIDQEKAREDEAKHRVNADVADTAARAILAQWKEVRAITENLPADQKEAIGTSNMLVTESQFLATELRDAFDEDRWADAVQKLADLAENTDRFPLSQRRTAINDHSRDRQKASKNLKKEVTNVLDTTDNGLSESEADALAKPNTEARLAESVINLNGIIERYLISEEKQHELKKSDVDDNKERMLASMAGFTDSVQDNFDLLKRVMSSRGGGASIKISGTVISPQGMREEIDSLVEEIDTQLSRRREDLESDRVLKETDEGFENSLRSMIRSEFYRAAFRAPESSSASGPRVYFNHPQIGGGRDILLSKDVSTGQFNALALLILVKLAGFSMQRDARNEYDGLPVPRAKRVSSARTVMIDGLFSNLSNKEMIRESLSVLRSLKGSFQLIGWIHNQQYENDYELFPACISVHRTGLNRGYVLAEDIDAAPLPRADEVAAIETHIAPMKQPETLNG